MYFDPCFKYLTIFFILENLSSKIGGYIHQFSLKMQIHRSDFNVTNISGTGTINVISTMHPLDNFLRSTSQKNNFYHSLPWFVSVIATSWYFQCWCFDYLKTTSLIYFLCLNIFSFLLMCFKTYVHYMYLDFTYKIVNQFYLWVFHLFAYNLQTLFFFDQNYTITGFHDVTTTFLLKKILYFAAASKYLCFIDFGPLYVSLLHIYIYTSHALFFGSWCSQWHQCI